MKLLKATFLSSLLAVSTVAAQVTGDWGRYAGKYGGGGSMLHKLLFWVFFLGLIVLVWLWVIKLGRELYQKKK